MRYSRQGQVKLSGISRFCYRRGQDLFFSHFRDLRHFLWGKRSIASGPRTPTIAPAKRAASWSTVGPNSPVIKCMYRVGCPNCSQTLAKIFIRLFPFGSGATHPIFKVMELTTLEIFSGASEVPIRAPATSISGKRRKCTHFFCTGERSS